MTRLSLLLSAAVLALLVGLPLLYANQRVNDFRNFRVVEEGKLYRSGQMSPVGFERVCREKGIRTVIKLREPSDEKDAAVDAAEKAYCEANGIMFYVFVPKNWEEENGKVPMEQNLRDFEELIDRTTDLAPRPVLIHCMAGIHRTGAHVAVYRMKYHGWTNAEAVAELQSCGKPTTTYVGNLIPFVLRYRPTRTVADADWRP